jgi:PEP-CTERM motif
LAQPLLFSDDFNSTPGFLINTPPPGWSVTDGTVDVIQNGTLGLPCLGDAASSCVDLDGTANNAGVLTFNTAFNLTAFTQYTLTYNLAGSHRGDSNTVMVCLGATCEFRTLASTDPYSEFQLVVTPLVDLIGQTVSFSNDGGDNVGSLLDNVSLTSNEQAAAHTPEPSTLMLLGTAVGLAILHRRRRTSMSKRAG